MRKGLTDLLFINAIQYKNNMRVNDCLPEGVCIINFELGDLPAVHTPFGDIILREGDYILTSIDGNYYVCDRHYFHSMSIHYKLKDIWDGEPIKSDKQIDWMHVLDKRLVELSSVYILNGEIIKVRPGYKGIVSDGIKELRGVYVQEGKHVHIFDDKHLDDVKSVLNFLKEHRIDIESNVTIYPVK